MIKYCSNCTSPCALVRACTEIGFDQSVAILRVGIRVDVTIGDEEETLKCLAIGFGLNNRFEWPGILE